jgi:hypothetical protein
MKQNKKMMTMIRMMRMGKHAATNISDENMSMHRTNETDGNDENEETTRK